MKNSLNFLMQALFATIPLIYIAAMWQHIPSQVPSHFNGDFIPDRFTSRESFLTNMIIMTAVIIITSALLLNLHRFDPKQRRPEARPLSKNISWLVTIILTLIMLIVTTQTLEQETRAENFSLKHIYGLGAILIVVLGNYMNNVKQNYFFGIRTPWTLENEDNWRRTHHFASKVWFFGGILLFAAIMFSPVEAARFILLIAALVLAGISVGYSYLIYKKNLKA